MTVDEIKAALKLVPHPVEGGYFAETYRSELSVTPDALAGAANGVMGAYPAARFLSTAIFYMLTPGTMSAMHRVRGDELFHFYLGDPVEMLQLHSDGRGEIVVLGHDILSGMKIQHNVPAGVWQGSLLREGGGFALMGTTMAPGFDYGDYETGDRESLIANYPGFAAAIRARTKT